MKGFLKTFAIIITLLSLGGCVEQGYKTVAFTMNSLFFINIFMLVVSAITFNKMQQASTSIGAISVLSIIFLCVVTLVSDDIAFNFPFFVSKYLD